MLHNVKSILLFMRQLFFTYSEAELRPTAAELLEHDFIKGFDHSFEFPSFYAEGKLLKMILLIFSYNIAMSKFKEQTWFDGESSYQSSMTGQSCI